MSSRNIRAALCDFRIVTIWLSLNKLSRLSNLCSLSHFFISDFLVSVFQIRRNCSREQYAFLRNISESSTQIMLGHLANIHSVY